MHSMGGKTVVVTGASSGIGKVTALELSKAGARVVMVCRSGQKAQEVGREITQAAGREDVELLTADLSSQSSVHAVAGELRKRCPRIDVLINNAGIYAPERRMTEDGLESTFATNHVAYFLLTNLVLDVIKASAPARIVNVSSEAHRIGKIDFENLRGEKPYGPVKAYCQSKLANILFTYELARRLEGTNVTVNCLHPGTVRSGFGRGAKGLMGAMMPLARLLMISAEKGARTSIFLASSPEVEGISGRYFIKCKPAKSIAASHDRELAKRLWEVSEQLTGLSAQPSQHEGNVVRE